MTMLLSSERVHIPDASRADLSGSAGPARRLAARPFGNALIDAWLATQGRTPESFNAVERLCYTAARHGRA